MKKQDELVLVLPRATLADIEADLAQVLSDINVYTQALANARARGEGRKAQQLEQAHADAWARKRQLLCEKAALKEAAVHPERVRQPRGRR